MNFTPRELDSQAVIQVERWIDLYSDEAKSLDGDHELSVHMYKICMEAGKLKVDSVGRLWGMGSNGFWNPFHFEHGRSFIGYRVSKLAAN